MGVHGGLLRAKYFGLKGDNTPEDMTKVNKLIEAAGTNTNKERIIDWGPGIFRFPSTIQINYRGLRFLGERMRETEDLGGTRFEFAGTGPLIQLGTDSGNPYDANEYNGIQGFEMSDIHCTTTKTDGTLANGHGTYGVGQWGLADWRGGDLVLNRVRFARFERGIHLVQSDINTFNHFLVTQNKLGMYVGPRTDQQRYHGWYSFHNDLAIHIDGPRSVKFFGGEWVDDGTSTNAAIKINNTFGIGASSIAFYSPWLERLSTTGGLIPAFFDVSTADSVVSTGISVIKPWCIALPGRQNYIMRVGNAAGVELDRPAGDTHIQGNFVRWVQTVGTYSGDVTIRAPGNRAEGNALWEKEAGSTGSPIVYVEGPRGFGSTPSFTPNNTGLGSGNGSISMSGNNEVGQLNFTTGASPGAGPVQLGTVTFGQPFSHAPRHIEIVAQNERAADAAWAVYVPRSSISTTAFQVWLTNGQTLSPSQAYQWSYRVVR